MANVYEHALDTYDFFDTVVNFMSDVNDSREWEDFIEDTAEYAAEDCPNSVISVRSRFEDFLYRHDYSDKIADILYDAMRAFTNERISETGANFDYC